jgi:2Fe-2S ferredoxin
MTKVVYIEFDGVAREIDVPEGWTVMQGAVSNGVNGIDGECGGACACGTCHVYVDEKTYALLPPPDDNEAAMLDGVAADVRPTSRLGCQITVTPSLQGLTVQIPKTQG